MPLILRLAHSDDDAALADLDRRTWAVENAVMARPETGARFFTNSVPDDVLVAELDCVVVGWTKLAKATPLPSNAHVAQIQGLAVDHAVRGRGIGRALLERACEVARERGARRIWLRVLATNPGAKRLYESVGFAVEGELPGEFQLGGVYVDDVIMGRSLTGS